MSVKVIRDPGCAKVDIVFVHGWHGDQAPWTSTKNSVFWPEKLLPVKVPEARILSYEYTLMIEDFWNEEDSIFDLSNDLMFSLEDQRYKEEEEYRPIIFVAHCLGGLVCENALATWSQHPRRRKLVGCVQGILLLGTPHFQLDTLAAATKYFQLTQEEIPEDSALKEKSRWVISVPQKFASLRKSGTHISVECFYEGSAMRINDNDVTIVDRSLARCLDGPQPQELGGNHQQISQFESDSNSDFVKVSRVLTTWVAKIPSPEKDVKLRRVLPAEKESMEQAQVDAGTKSDAQQNQPHSRHGCYLCGHSHVLNTLESIGAKTILSQLSIVKASAKEASPIEQAEEVGIPNQGEGFNEASEKSSPSRESNTERVSAGRALRAVLFSGADAIASSQEQLDTFKDLDWQSGPTKGAVEALARVLGKSRPLLVIFTETSQRLGKAPEVNSIQLGLCDYDQQLEQLSVESGRDESNHVSCLVTLLVLEGLMCCRAGLLRFLDNKPPANDGGRLNMQYDRFRYKEAAYDTLTKLQKATSGQFFEASVQGRQDDGGAFIDSIGSIPISKMVLTTLRLDGRQIYHYIRDAQSPGPACSPVEADVLRALLLWSFWASALHNAFSSLQGLSVDNLQITRPRQRAAAAPHYTVLITDDVSEVNVTAGLTVVDVRVGTQSSPQKLRGFGFLLATLLEVRGDYVDTSSRRLMEILEIPDAITVASLVLRLDNSAFVALLHCGMQQRGVTEHVELPIRGAHNSPRYRVTKRVENDVGRVMNIDLRSSLKYRDYYLSSDGVYQTARKTVLGLVAVSGSFLVVALFLIFKYSSAAPTSNLVTAAFAVSAAILGMGPAVIYKDWTYYDVVRLRRRVLRVSQLAGLSQESVWLFAHALRGDIAVTGLYRCAFPDSHSLRTVEADIPVRADQLLDADAEIYLSYRPESGLEAQVNGRRAYLTSVSGLEIFHVEQDADGNRTKEPPESSTIWWAAASDILFGATGGLA